MEPTVNVATTTTANTAQASGNDSKLPAPPKFDRVDSVIGTTDEKVSAAAAAATTTMKTMTTTKTTAPRVLQLHEWKEAALSLAEAFADDHSCKYFLETPDTAHWSKEQKWDLHLKMMEYITYAHLLKGLVVSAGPNYDCVALWMPPGNNMDDYLTLFRSGMWRLNYLLSPEGKKRFFTEFLPLLHDTKTQVLGADRDATSYYLVYLGTRPSGRGQGYAREVVEYVTAMADAEGRACYLESSNVVNRGIYGRMGFEVRKQVYLQRDWVLVELDIMVREPVRRAGV